MEQESPQIDSLLGLFDQFEMSHEQWSTLVSEVWHQAEDRRNIGSEMNYSAYSANVHAIKTLVSLHADQMRITDGYVTGVETALERFRKRALWLKDLVPASKHRPSPRSRI